MNLTKYRKTSREIKALATRYWLAVILEHLQLDNLNQLSAFINNQEGITEHAKCSTSFLYKKWQGSPIDNETKITLMEELVPGSSQCLTNPLWQLLDNPCSDLTYTTRIINSLNTQTTNCLFEPLTDMAFPKRLNHLTHSQIKHIARFNDPDALTCLLALSLEDNSSKRSLERYAYQLFIRLTAFTPLKVIKNELYALTYSIFFPKTSEETEQILSFDQYICPDTGSKTLLRIGSAFIPINEIYLKQLHEYYLKISKDMISLNLIQDTHDEKMLFNHLLDNTDQGWIKVGISALKNGITQDYSNKHLSQLLRRMKYINRIK